MDDKELQQRIKDFQNELEKLCQKYDLRLTAVPQDPMLMVVPAPKEEKKV